MSMLGERTYGLITITALSLTLLLMSMGCGGGGGGGDDSGPQLASLPSVTALFPLNGTNWNDYVQGGSAATATDTACNAATDTACVHGGELRVVSVPTRTGCTGLTATDALGAFDWTCDAGSGTAQFTSTGLKADANLSDLLNFSTAGWRANRVTVAENGTAFAATPSEVWWSNPIMASNGGNSGSAMAAGDIYVIQSNPSATYTIGAHKVALVAKPGLLVTGSTTAAETIVSANNKDFIWFEGSINADTDSAGVNWNNVRFSMIRNVYVEKSNGGGWDAGVVLQSSLYSKVRSVSTYSTASYGFALSSSLGNDVRDVRCVKDAWLAEILVSTSSNNYFEDIVAIHGRQMGIDIYQSNNNRFVNVTANNNHSYGINLEMGSSNNVLLNVDAENNFDGIRLYSPTLDNIIAGLTSANNSGNGIVFFGITVGPQTGYPTNNLVMSAVAANNNYSLYMYQAADSNHFIDLALADSSIGVYLNNISNTTFAGRLMVGNNSSSNCTVSGGTLPGLVDGTCANNGSSTATLTTGMTTSGSFVGKVLTTDTVNGSNTNGAAQFQDITDWLNFSTPLRRWGRDGNTYPDATNRQYCGVSGATDACRIWDWSLASSDTVLKGALTLPTGNDTMTHTLSTATTITFLQHAVEILNDGTGNENGLCESSEICLYTPNIGSYQGHGNLVSAGTFTNGTITGVTLMKYEFNGR